jgi:branched-subunit amino acid aminotransferase/4-amino-4-deoxychorismate lyase
MSQGIAYVDGKVLELAKARIPLHERGYLLGDGVFETLRTSNGRPFRLDEHAARMKRGLRAINLDESLESEFRDAVDALVSRGVSEFGGELYVRVMISTGPLEDLLDTGRGVTVTGICKKFRPYPMQYYSNGIQLIVSRSRKDSRSPIAPIKTLSFLPYIMARREAHAQTAHEAVLLNEHDRIAEAATSNVFALVGGKVHAPGESEGAIPGVTRGAVLELLEGTGHEVVEQLPVSLMRKADEVWLTNTTGGIVPVTRFMDRPVGNGKKGPLTTKLSHALEDQIRGGKAPRVKAAKSGGAAGKPTSKAGVAASKPTGKLAKSGKPAKSGKGAVRKAA